MAVRTHRTVVRNQAYRAVAFNVRERHNERKNECYGNGDIVPERAGMNVHFRQLFTPDGAPETYEAAFNRMLAAGEISTRGLKADPNVFDEMIYDVNSEYFESRGGYDYAKSFFEEAYRLAVKEAGGEQYILSAVMHADERNKALSDELGRDVFHYHLHVVYIPVVRKEVYFKKNNKNPELAGKLKEVITQISHSKKWPIKVPVERNGKAMFLNSYAQLQDRFFEHMRDAGFDGFERGERGSTAEHLSDLEYKTARENERLGNVIAEVQEQINAVSQLSQTAAAIDETVERKKKQVAVYNKKLTASKQAGIMFDEIERMARPTLFGGKRELTSSDWETISELAKKGLLSDVHIADFKEKLAATQKDANIYRRRWESLQSEVKPLLDALRRSPNKMTELVKNIMEEPPERSAQNPDQRRKTKTEVL